ncbi:hypothetical protein PIB30_027474 [Stylosanthes scabra]|uniref:Homeobox domain-containing protein n=1 Tax=Stylosanthes scabra TaxID=79078 RepID=A0ABU6QAB1_9FABA|nr:hypothetical protein [Stylosanthes scabra]
MATYFHGNSEIQGGGVDGGLQTLVLMNPGYIQYSDTPPPPHGGNLMLLNSLTAAGNASLNPHAPLSQQFLGVPLAAEQSMQGHHDVSVALHGYAPRGHYNLWNTIDASTAARDATRATQGLSLSLPAMSGEDVRVSGGSPSSVSGVTNGVSGIQSVLLNSKYLRATQELLEEVVNVNNNINNNVNNNNNNMKKKSFEKGKVGVGESSNGGNSGGDGSVGEGSEKRCAELSATERQEIQMKKAKLITMLDEVEQRYRQYHNQMQIVISSFEQAAGIGSARTYTSLALQTISKQFRCLKDAITAQIKAANKSLGEEDYFGGAKIEGSRLKYVDHHLRQQRAIQQLGMIHHNAWRPQRGLPERSVSVLRAWLFEHFLHPYPKDSDKHMLAKQTGLTRSQVSNWFINARVRLWKPMVEEMYLEEMKDHELNNSNNNNNASEDNKSSKSNGDPNNAKNSPPRDNNNSESETKKIFNLKQDNSVSISPTPIGEKANSSSGFSFMGSSSELLDGITQQGSSPKKPRNNNNEIVHHHSQNSNNDIRDNEYSFINNVGSQTNFIGGFGQYPIDEIGRFDASAAENFTRFSSGNNNNNNGVSLTLGLPHGDTFQNIQLGRRLEHMSSEQQHSNEFAAVSNNQNPHHSSAAFQSMQNSKRFAAQLLPDYVA